MKSGLLNLKRAFICVLALLALSLCGFSASFAEAGSEAGVFLDGGNKIEWTCGVPYEDPGFSAYDKAGNDMSDKVSVTGQVSCWKVGTYKLRYFFKDAEGERYNAFRTVEVVPAELPEARTREKTIYLSFDDGPCENTEWLLNLLDSYGAKATFFIINQNSPYMELLGEIHDRGHSVGVHCTNHDYGRLYSSEDFFFEDFITTQQAIYERIGEYAKVSRFPGGSTTARGFIGHKVEGGFETVEQRLYDMGVRYYDWNIQLEGPGNTYRSAKEMYYTFTLGVQQYETPVVLQHDTLLFSIKALEPLLKWGVENGYTFAALDNTVPNTR